MDIEGTYRFAAPPEVVWQVICDPAALKQSIPQCETIDRLNETQWRGTARVKVGPVSALFTGLISLFNLNPPQSYTIRIDAESWLGKSFGTADVTLTPEGSDTVLTYKANVHVGIKALDKAMNMASGLAHTLADKFFAKLALAIAEKQEAAKVEP